MRIKKGGIIMEAVVSVFNELGSALGITVTQVAVANFIPAVIVLIVGLIAVKLIMKGVNKAIEKTNLEKSLHTFVKSAIKFVL